MPYAAAVSYEKLVDPDGRRIWVVSVTETLARDTSEFSFTVPRVGLLLRSKHVLSGGTGTTIQPRTSWITGAVAADFEVVEEFAAAAAKCDQMTLGGDIYRAPTNTFYTRSAVNSVVEDHTIEHEFIFEEIVP